MPAHAWARAATPRRMTLLSALAVAIYAAAAGGLALPAAAHSALLSSDPADGETLATSPERVLLTFNENILEMGTSIEITGPGGADATEGEPQLDGPEVSQRLTGDLADGNYTMVWRVVSADGHPIDGELSFTIKAGPGAAEPSTEDKTNEPTQNATKATDDAPEPTEEPTDDPEVAPKESDSTGWKIALFAVIALAVIGGVVGAIVKLHRAS